MRMNTVPANLIIAILAAKCKTLCGDNLTFRHYRNGCIQNHVSTSAPGFDGRPIGHFELASYMLIRFRNAYVEAALSNISALLDVATNRDAGVPVTGTSRMPPISAVQPAFGRREVR